MHTLKILLEKASCFRLAPYTPSLSFSIGKLLLGTKCSNVLFLVMFLALEIWSFEIDKKCKFQSSRKYFLVSLYLDIHNHSVKNAGWISWIIVLTNHLFVGSSYSKIYRLQFASLHENPGSICQKVHLVMTLLAVFAVFFLCYHRWVFHQDITWQHFLCSRSF